VGRAEGGITSERVRKNSICHEAKYFAPKEASLGERFSSENFSETSSGWGSRRFLQHRTSTHDIRLTSFSSLQALDDLGETQSSAGISRALNMIA
jgi:hypothetical protein